MTNPRAGHDANAAEPERPPYWFGRLSDLAPAAAQDDDSDTVQSDGIATLAEWRALYREGYAPPRIGQQHVCGTHYVIAYARDEDDRVEVLLLCMICAIFWRTGRRGRNVTLDEAIGAALRRVQGR